MLVVSVGVKYVVDLATELLGFDQTASSFFCSAVLVDESTEMSSRIIRHERRFSISPVACTSTHAPMSSLPEPTSSHPALRISCNHAKLPSIFAKLSCTNISYRCTHVNASRTYVNVSCINATYFIIHHLPIKRVKHLCKHHQGEKRKDE